MPKTVITFEKFVSLIEGALAIQLDGNAVVYPYIDHDVDDEGNFVPNYVQVAYWDDGSEFEFIFSPDEITEIYVEDSRIMVEVTEPEPETFVFRLLDTVPIVL